MRPDPMSAVSVKALTMGSPKATTSEHWDTAEHVHLRVFKLAG